MNKSPMLTRAMGRMARMFAGTRRPPPETPPDLESAIHTLRRSAGLGRLTSNQVDTTLQALRESGRLDHLFTEAGYPRVTAEQLDHVVHAMRLSGELSRLTKAQMDNVVYALHTAGHLAHLRDLSNAAYNDGHLISFHNADFLQDPRFIEAYRLGQYTNSWQGFDIRWRIYVLCWAAAHARTLPGDFVECGVNRGGNVRAVMHYIDFGTLTDRRFYLLDTYCGIPEQDRATAPTCYHHAYSDCYEEVVERFRPFANVRVIRGRVPDTLVQVPSERVCFLSIDMNCVDPEIAAAEFFWDRLVPGALVLLDDYGAGVWHLPQKHAFDAFARRKGVEVLTLPTCQGLITKP